MREIDSSGCEMSGDLGIIEIVLTPTSTIVGEVRAIMAIRLSNYFR